MTNKEKFEYLLRETHRDGIEDLIKYLNEETDFYTAPASSKFHNNFAEGLLQHSLNVYDNLFTLCQFYGEGIDMNSIIIVGLLHDLCKVNFYKLTTRNVKVGNFWTTQPYYDIEDKLPLGHGEKSVMIIQDFIKLTDEEKIAIRWHMGGFDSSVKGGSYDMANVQNTKYCKLMTLLQCADLISSNIIEMKK